ncbi:MAG: tRNA 2-selenouridine(34) synthase MnmH [Cyanobacteriota bacterium]|nr:tRNA 2-selenouridine(34) synthase MnmH [Cyanobacteriota bacterium]
MGESGVEPFLEASGPLVDVRSPAEFAKGHIPGALNLPLFCDAERAAVGTAYKQVGRQQAVALGLGLVGPRLESLADGLCRALAGREADARLRLHCWRGGLRSSSVAWLAGVLNLPVLVLEGGYKHYRHWVLQRFEHPWPLRVLAGRTGSGKTDLLLAMAELGEAVVDLEGLAHHRGSSFGGLGMPPQPSSEHYENRLAQSLWQQRQAPAIWLEAESAQVGRCRIPAGLWRQMQQAPAVEINRPLQERVERLVAVYGHQGQEGLRQATERIARRLGPQRTRAALEAIAAHDWATACRQMLDYYDRCYDHELQQRSEAAVPRLELAGLTDADAGAALLAWGLGRSPGRSAA